MKIRALLIALLLSSCAALAQEGKVRAHVEPLEKPWVGQQRVLVVELLAPGYFSGSPDFDLPPVRGLLIFPPNGRPVLGSETIDGITYTVQRHEILIFPRKAGEFTIPAFQVRFNTKRSPLDKDAVPQSVTTQPQQITAAMPPGAEDIGTLISARELHAGEQWNPDPGNAKTGAAFTRTITWTAPDIPGMAFPPFPMEKIDGLGIYPKDPVVNDRAERGTLTGQRVETITYICEKPGRYVIPAARFTWWSTEDLQLHTIDFPERTMEVAPNPAYMRGAQTVRSSSIVTLLYKNRIMLLCFIAGAAVLAYGWAKAGVEISAFFRPVHLAQLNPPQKQK